MISKIYKKGGRKMNIYKKLLGIIFISLVFAIPAIAVTETNYDTNGDDKQDFRLRTDRDSEGNIVFVHFDKNNNGSVEDGEPVIKCKKISIASGGGPNGYTFRITCDTGKERTTTVIFVHNLNDDTDVADDRELIYRTP